jgi:nitroimidazol reductase NimA-like FMN-containing flavoprotein (pyridoxamine 5'-phosphate oxidase superfamily)
MRLRKAHAEFLRHQRVVHVATATPGGAPHVVPVCAVLVDGRLYFASGTTGRKIANLRANPRIAVSADDYTEAWGALRGLVVTGTARLITARGPFRRIRRLLYAKYPQYPTESAIEEGDSLVVEVTPTGVVSWGF